MANIYLCISIPHLIQENGILIESVDACFGLARRKAKGGNIMSSKHGDLIFSDQDDVDNYVDIHTLGRLQRRYDVYGYPWSVWCIKLTDYPASSLTLVLNYS